MLLYIIPSKPTAMPIVALMFPKVSAHGSDDPFKIDTLIAVRVEIMFKELKLLRVALAT